MDPQRKAKLKAALAFLLVFLLGGGTGYVAGYWQALEGPWSGWRGRAWGPAARGGDRAASRTEYFLRKLERDLGLKPEQRDRASDILRRHHESFVELRREMGPRIDGILREIRAELRSMMEPGQQAHFDRMMREMDEHRRRWRERRGSGRGMMGPGMMHEGSGRP